MKISLLASSLLLLSSCASDDIFPSIGTNLANPISIAINSVTNRAYVVSSNDKVFYDTGSLQVLDISTPASPARVGTAELANFSGEAYLDAVNNNLYVTNRLSSDNDDGVDSLLRVNITEGGGSFLSISSYDAGANPFGIAYDATGTNIYATTRESKLDYFPLASLSRSSISLSSLTLSDGTSFTSSDLYDVAILGRQAFITRPSDGVLVVDLDEKNVDYYISDISSPRGIAADATNVYVVSGEPMLYILNPATLTARSGNSDVTVIDKDTSGIVAGSVSVGTDPQDVSVGTNYIFVSNKGADTVTAINKPAYTVAQTITVGDEPIGLGLYSPGGADTHLFVANYGGNSVSIINIGTLAVVGTY